MLALHTQNTHCQMTFTDIYTWEITLMNPHLGLRADGCTSFQHHVHYLFMPRPGSTVEGREAIPCLGLDISPLLQEQWHHVSLPPLGSHMQWCNIMLQVTFLISCLSHDVDLSNVNGRLWLLWGQYFKTTQNHVWMN